MVLLYRIDFLKWILKLFLLILKKSIKENITLCNKNIGCDKLYKNNP